MRVRWHPRRVAGPSVHHAVWRYRRRWHHPRAPAACRSPGHWRDHAARIALVEIVRRAGRGRLVLRHEVELNQAWDGPESVKSSSKYDPRYDPGYDPSYNKMPGESDE